jgi:protein-disulfide isomerase
MNLLLRTLICLSLFTVGAHAAKAKKTLPPLPEVSVGSPDAPILIIDYSSLTCHHCAGFYLNVLPKIEEKYIKPGYVRVVFRDFPGDQVSIKAHQVAWCKGEIKYLDFVKLLYSTQEKWLSAKDPVAALKAIVLQHGISAEQFDAALKNQELLDKILQARLEGQKKYKINATPTLIINAKIHQKALTFDEIEEMLSPILKPSSEEKGQKKEDKKDTLLKGKKKRT